MFWPRTAAEVHGFRDTQHTQSLISHCSGLCCDLITQSLGERAQLCDRFRCAFGGHNIVQSQA